MFFQRKWDRGESSVGRFRPCTANQASSADVAMNPRDAANAKGCIDWVMSFTKTKLLPHVPEMRIRFNQRLGSARFAMRPTANQLSALERLWRIERADRPGAGGIGVTTDCKDGCSDCISDHDVIGGKPIACASNRIPDRFL